MASSVSNGSSADYYKLPDKAKQLQDLISYKNMNAQVGEAFRSLYRYGESSHSDKARDIRKVLYYCQKELERLVKYEGVYDDTEGAQALKASFDNVNNLQLDEGDYYEE